MTELGTMLRLPDLRAAWSDEARDFTPWLAREESLSILASALGLGEDGLELEAMEREVGPFRADILCKRTRDDAWVLIENQLERTDHRHLGQIVTYAAGLKAGMVVWIASAFTEEHRAAFDWLNEMTVEDLSFFAVEVQLWKIGDSLPAPRFDIVAGPNDWSRAVSREKKRIDGEELSESQKLRRRYWAGLADQLSRAAGPIRPVSPSKLSWTTHGIGRTNFGANASFTTVDREVRAEVYIMSRNALHFFNQLFADKDQIEAELGDSLDWQELPHANDCRICFKLQNTDPLDEKDWPRQHRWLAEKLNDLHRVFSPRIRSLSIPEPDEEDHP